MPVMGKQGNLEAEAISAGYLNGKSASAKAFKVINETGVRVNLKRQVYDFIVAYEEPCSLAEILPALGRLGANSSSQTARIGELVDEGFIQKVGEKVSEISGHIVSLFVPTDKKYEILTSKMRLKKLGCKTLEDYYKTLYWRMFFRDYFVRHPKVCFVTGSCDFIQLHHLHYETIGEETDEDVVPLSRDVHTRVHRLAKEFKISLGKAHLVMKAILDSNWGLSPT